jgi:hypothetical protein
MAWLREHPAGVGADVPAVRCRVRRDDADGRVRLLLHVRCVLRVAAPEAGGLLRLLLVRVGQVPAEAAGRLALRLRLSPLGGRSM